MDALTIDLELVAIQEKTRRLGVWSFLAHAAGLVVFLVIATQPVPERTEDDYVITEVTWLEIEDIVPAPTPVVVAPPEPVAETPVVVQETPKPKPVIPPRDAGVDMMQQRLAALRTDDAGRREITAAATVDSPDRPAPATLGAMIPRPTTPTGTLKRSASRPVAHVGELTKGETSVVAAAVTSLPEAEGDASAQPAQEILPGVSLAGEVSNRKLIDYNTPEYPEWAKRDGVEVSVELYFTVLPSGRLKENLLIERTSGFDDFDSRAKAALANWRFESLGPGASAEQWGRIEFKYRLRDAG